MTIELGKKYRDRVTGFEGIATARHEYLNGCLRITLTATTLKEGAPLEPQTFDIEQVDFVDAGIHTVKRDTGGPADPPRPRYEPRNR